MKEQKKKLQLINVESTLKTAEDKDVTAVNLWCSEDEYSQND